MLKLWQEWHLVEVVNSIDGRVTQYSPFGGELGNVN